MTRDPSKNVRPPVMLYGVGTVKLAELAKFSYDQLQQELTLRALANGDQLEFALRHKYNETKLYICVSDYGLELELSGGYRLSLPAQSQQLTDLALAIEMAQQASLLEVD